MIRVQDLHIGHGSHVLCEGITFQIAPGECVLLTGANGSGKTTLLKALAQGPLRERTVMIPTGIPKVKGFTLEAFIRSSCYRESTWRGRLGIEAETRLQQAMELLGIQPLARHDLSTLSDGEFQKGCIAAALVRRAALLLLDEPTAYLDLENRLAVLSALRDVSRRQQTAILFSSHDIHEALPVADRVFTITPGRRFLASSSDPSSKAAAVRSGFRSPADVKFMINSGRP